MEKGLGSMINDNKLSLTINEDTVNFVLKKYSGCQLLTNSPLKIKKNAQNSERLNIASEFTSPFCQ